MIAIAVGVKGRSETFRHVFRSLAEQSIARQLNLLVLDGNASGEEFVDSAVMSSFGHFRVWKECQVLPQEHQGRWPLIYNFLLSQSDDPFLTYWSDVRCEHNGCLERAVALLEENSNSGALCFPWRNGQTGHTHIYRTERHDRPLLNFALIRRRAFDQVGGLDERYRFYYADQDLSLRLWSAGWNVLTPEYEEVLTLTHLGGEKSVNPLRSEEWVVKDRSTFHAVWG